MRFVFFFFFFKQKTADEMRISDWSSDVCSSDLNRLLDEFLSLKKIVLLSDETLSVIGKLGHIIPFEKWGEPKPAPAGSRNRALTCPEEITVSNGSPLGEIPGAAASGGFEGGTERNLGDRKSVVEGKSVSVRVDLGGRSIIKKKKQTHINVHRIII